MNFTIPATSKVKCPVCSTQAIMSPIDLFETLIIYTCPICGKFEGEGNDPFKDIDLNQLGSYLFYNRHLGNSSATEDRFYTTLDKKSSDSYNEIFKDSNVRKGHSVHIDSDIIENWYPKSFAERTDMILLYLGSQIKHIGQFYALNMQETFSLLFIDRYENIDNTTTNDKNVARKRSVCLDEAKYMLDFLKTSLLIEYNYGSSEDKFMQIQLTPKGYARIDELQKNTGYGKNVLVAMKFGDDTKTLREAIRLGIQTAGYIAIFIDEVQHNDFITPELLKHIRDSKFVVVDLTHQNNGAYFEEGYAMGLGKPVIQLCKKDIKLHFDIAQKNTIMWENEAEISERLKNRIIATID